MSEPEDEQRKPADVMVNGFIDSWLVSFGGHVVMTGLTLEASQAYADHLNKERRTTGLKKKGSER